MHTRDTGRVVSLTHTDIVPRTYDDIAGTPCAACCTDGVGFSLCGRILLLRAALMASRWNEEFLARNLRNLMLAKPLGV